MLSLRALLLSSVPAALLVLAPTSPVQAQEASILALMREREELTAFVGVIELLGFADELDDCSASPMTLFAPEDIAFTSAASEFSLEVDELLGDALLLRPIVEHHWLDGASRSDDLVALGMAPTRLGDEIEVIAEEDFVLLDGYASILEADIEACNGILHSVDSVMTPADLYAEQAITIGGGEDLGEIALDESSTSSGSGERIVPLGLSVVGAAVGFGMIRFGRSRRPT